MRRVSQYNSARPASKASAAEKMTFNAEIRMATVSSIGPPFAAPPKAPVIAPACNGKQQLPAHLEQALRQIMTQRHLKMVT